MVMSFTEILNRTRSLTHNRIYNQYVKQCLLREELEYDTYVGENYKTEEYGINHW